MDPRKQAARDAESLLHSAWDDYDGQRPIPVDPVRIAKRLGLDVIVSALPQNVYAALVKKQGQDPVIVLNESDAPNRQRFSAGHELGHYMRRSDDEYSYVDHRDMLSAEGKSPDELYANSFAAALLMPEDEVKRRFRRDPNEVRLALAFDVSREAMHYRLQNLGLIT